MLRNYPLEREPDLIRVREILYPGATAIDIGASIGLYTRFMAEWVGPTGWVFACEPMPATCDVLRRNIRGLNLWNVIVMETAVSDTTGSLHMDIPDSKSHYYARISSDGKYTVVAHTFDELFGGLNEVALVKCDVEGHEPELLRGADKFLSNCNAVWLMEMDKSGDDITSIFERYGYRPEHSDSVNCFFTRQ